MVNGKYDGIWSWRQKPNNIDMKKSNLTLSLITLAMVMATENLWAIPAPPPTVPDAGSSMFLLTMGVAAVAMVRKVMR
jgi:hypothetical protein